MTQPRSKICKGCWQQLRVPVPLYGPASIPFRVFGIRPSRMNPNTCTICELMFTKIMRARNIKLDATVLFADLRNFTALSQTQTPESIAGLLDAFSDVCASAIWDGDGLLNKSFGDGVMAVFNFPIAQADHAKQGVLAAREITRRWEKRRQSLVDELGISEQELGVGIGLHCGEVSFGEFGHSHRDLTAIGNVVNLASRAQSVAAGGQILATQAIRQRVPEEFVASTAKSFDLKGFTSPIELYSA